MGRMSTNAEGCGDQPKGSTVSDTRTTNETDHTTVPCPTCAALTAEVGRLRRALTEIRRWTIEATHPRD
jgi:hypothetical protein